MYGASKRAGELTCTPEDSVVRTSWVMGVRGKNVVHTIADRATSGADVRFVNDQTGTVTASSDLARALVVFVRERPGGLWHVANSGATTWYDIAEYVGSVSWVETRALRHRLSRASWPTFQVAARPTRSDLDTHRFAARWESLPEWHGAVERLVNDRRFLETTT